MKKIIAALTVLTAFILSALPVFASSSMADGLEIVFEENFEEYESGVNVNSTTMPSFFVCDYNGIGDGMISVQESGDGNLELKSHVFTQIYTSVPLTGAYEFSIEVYEAQGKLQSGVFVRAPKCAEAYYESDGYPDISTCQSGIYICPHDRIIGVNIKTYDENASSTCYLANNITDFEVKGADNYPYVLKITDDGERIRLYSNDELVCSIALSDPGKHYEKHTANAYPCFGSAVLYDADGKEIATYKDPLIQSDASIFGWSTRASDMRVDNIVVKAEKAYNARLLIDRIPSKITEKNLNEANPLIKAAREAFDLLTEEEQARVVNAEKLISAEKKAAELAPDTTEKETEPPETETDARTEQNETEPSAGTSVTTDKTPDGTETDGDDPSQTAVADDSLEIWIITAVILAMIGAAAGFVVHKVRK